MTERWCEEHQTEYFKKGHMKGYAHPIGDTGKWCNEEKAKPAKSEGDHLTDAPPVKEVKAPNFRSPVNRSIAISYAKDLCVAGKIELKELATYADKFLAYIEKGD